MAYDAYSSRSGLNTVQVSFVDEWSYSGIFSFRKSDSVAFPVGATAVNR